MTSADIILNRLNSFKKDKSKNVFNTRNVRDLVITELTDEIWLVTACDSDGGIGPKPLDTFSSTAYDLGRLGMRVPLMEILASGAEPFLTADLLMVEMEPTGKEIIRGIKDELADAEVSPNTAVTGSTEDNVRTVQTGMGVVIMGFVHKNDFNPGKSREGDIIAAMGIPKSAPEYKIVYNDPEIADPQTIRRLIETGLVHDILPVGSKGIQHEISELAATAGLVYKLNKKTDVSITKSGGPSTCCLVSLEEENLPVLREKIRKPISVLGKLRK
jgi:hypothetical protein